MNQICRYALLLIAAGAALWAETVTIEIGGTVPVVVPTGGSRSVGLVNAQIVQAPGSAGSGFTVAGSGASIQITHQVDSTERSSGSDAATCVVMTTQGEFTLDITAGDVPGSESISVRFDDGAGGGDGGSLGDGSTDGDGGTGNDDGTSGGGGTKGDGAANRIISGERVAAAIKSAQAPATTLNTRESLRNQASILDGKSGSVSLAEARDILAMALGFYRDFHYLHSTTWWPKFSGIPTLSIRGIPIASTNRDKTLLSFRSAATFREWGKLVFANLQVESSSQTMQSIEQVVGSTTPSDFYTRANRIGSSPNADASDIGIIYGVLSLSRGDSHQVRALDVALDRRRASLDAQYTWSRSAYATRHLKGLDAAWEAMVRLPAATPREKSWMVIRDLELFWRELLLTACCEAESALNAIGNEGDLARELGETMEVAGNTDLRPSIDFPPYETLLGPDYPKMLKKALFWAGGPSAGANLLPPIKLPSQRLIGSGLLINAVMAEFEAYYPDKADPTSLPNPEKAKDASVKKYISDARQVLDGLYAQRATILDIGRLLVYLGHEVGRPDSGGVRQRNITTTTGMLRLQVHQLYGQYRRLDESTGVVPFSQRGSQVPPTIAALAAMDELEAHRLSTAVVDSDLELTLAGEWSTTTPELNMGGARIDQPGASANTAFDIASQSMLAGMRDVLAAYKDSLAQIPRLADKEQAQWDIGFVYQWLRHDRSGQSEPAEVLDLMGNIRRERVAYHQAVYLWLETMRRYGQRRLRDEDFNRYLWLRPQGPTEPPDPAVGADDLADCYRIQRRIAFCGLAFPAYQHVAAHLIALQQSLIDREALYMAIRAARAATVALENERQSKVVAPTDQHVPLKQ